MKSIPEDIAGKRIAGVVLLEGADPQVRPGGQLVLCFDDGTSFEFWSSEGIHPAGGFDRDTLVDIVQKAPPQVEVRQVVSAERKAKDIMHILLYGILQMENDVSYIIECLSEDCRAEAIRGFHDACDCLDKFPYPTDWREKMKRHLDEAIPPLNGRDLISASRMMYRLRRRLANQAAWLMDEALPYSEKLYPLLLSEQEEGEVGFKRAPESE
jgi:hypothetical protein